MEHATTLNLPTVATRNNARAYLADAVAAVLDAGGEIDQLDGFLPKPRPARTGPEAVALAPIKSRGANGLVLISCRGTVVKKNRAYAERAYRQREELANRLRPRASKGCIAYAALFDVSHSMIRSVAKQFGIPLGRSSWWPSLSKNAQRPQRRSASAWTRRSCAIVLGRCWRT